MLTSEQFVDSFARAFFAGFLPRSFYGVGRIARKLRHVDRRELAVALEKPAIDDDGIDVPGHGRLHNHVGRDGKRQHVDIRRPHQN